MENSEIVKKRLTDLKKLSQNLKQSTEVRNDLDINLIKAIFEITKSSNPALNQSSSSRNIHNHSVQQSQAQSPKLSKIMSTSFMERYLGKVESVEYNLNEQNIEPLFPENKSRSLRNVPSTSKLTHKADEDELIHLRQENCQLELQVRQLRETLRVYRERDEQSGNLKGSGDLHGSNEEEQHSSHGPYFHLTEQLELFATKISISRTDYNRIEYESHQLTLTLDKFVIQKHYEQNSRLKNEQATSTLQLALGNLSEVEYLGDNRMLIVFDQPPNEKTRLFLEFGNEDTLNRWDLATFINHKIIANLTTSRRFENDKLLRQPKLQTQAQNAKDEEASETNSLHMQPGEQGIKKLEKQVMLKYLDSKQKYIKSGKKLKQIMLHKINQKKSLRASQRNKQNQQQSNEKLMESDKQQQNQFMQVTIQKKEPELIESPQKQKAIEESQIIPSKELQIEEAKRKEEEQRLKKQEKRKKIHQAVDFLKQGVQLTKYAKSAFKPYQKKVFISKDNAKLCWQEIGHDEVKSINVDQIVSIARGEIGEGVKTHVNENKIKNLNCFILIKTKSKDRKNLQFSAKSLKLMEQFFDALTIFLGEFSRGHMKDDK